MSRVANDSRRSPTVERLKSTVRLVEAAIVRRWDALSFDGHELKFFRSRWWHDATAENFAVEIEPYFRALPDLARYHTIVDAGGATGQFTIAACARLPHAKVHAFEPSRRQRVLLARNARLNGVADRVRIWPMGLWHETTTLQFRTHGAIGSLASVSTLPSYLPFMEHVRVVSLDAWAERAAPGRIDLIKMDIEGAELEAIAGARDLLARDRPDVLVQAYHLRDGARTLERCGAILRSVGYDAREVDGQPGLLLGTSRP